MAWCLRCLGNSLYFTFIVKPFHLNIFLWKIFSVYSQDVQFSTLHAGSKLIEINTSKYIDVSTCQTAQGHNLEGYNTDLHWIEKLSSHVCVLIFRRTLAFIYRLSLNMTSLGIWLKLKWYVWAGQPITESLMVQLWPDSPILGRSTLRILFISCSMLDCTWTMAMLFNFYCAFLGLWVLLCRNVSGCKRIMWTEDALMLLLWSVD